MILSFARASFVFPLAAVAALALTPHAAHAQTAYVAGSGGEFGTIDLSSGDYTNITTTTPVFFGLGFSGGNLYGLTGNGELYQIDTNNGDTTDAGSTGLGNVFAFTSDSSGAFYAIGGSSDEELYTFTPASVTAQDVGNTGISPDGSLAFDSSGALYAGGLDPSNNDDLYTVDTSNNGAGTFVGPMFSSGTYLTSSVYADGALYGFGSDNNEYTIDTGSGTPTLVNAYSLGNSDNIYGAAFSPNASAAPEPSQMALFALVGAGLGALMLRARRMNTKSA